MLKKLLFVSLLSLLFAPSASAFEGTVSFTSPSGGETLNVGQNYTIAWNSSPNIDMVSIGYSFGEGSLNWIAYNHANTGSYNWNVNIGNTTNTNIRLEIIAYDVGEGSTSAYSNNFTVLGASSGGGSNASPSPAGTARPASSPGSIAPGASPFRPLLSPSPSPTPRPLTPRLSITNLVIWSEFIFEGSQTTDLSSISDPTSVESFTLDTLDGFTFVFSETLNLTNQTTLSAIQNTKDYWEFEAYYIWIKWEWWVKYDITQAINVTYENPSLTAFAPTLGSPRPISTNMNPSPSPLKVKSGVLREPPKILGAETGKVILSVNDGTPIVLEPRVILDTHSSRVSWPRLVLTGHTSHTDLAWSLKQNGVTTKVAPSIDTASGAFQLPVDGLSEGDNELVLSYTTASGMTKDLDPLSIEYKPTLWTRYGQAFLVILSLALTFFAGIMFPRLLPRIKTLLKLKK